MRPGSRESPVESQIGLRVHRLDGVLALGVGLRVVSALLDKRAHDRACDRAVPTVVVDGAQERLIRRVRTKPPLPRNAEAPSAPVIRGNARVGIEPEPVAHAHAVHGLGEQKHDLQIGRNPRGAVGRRRGQDARWSRVHRTAGGKVGLRAAPEEPPCGQRRSERQEPLERAAERVPRHRERRVRAERFEARAFDAVRAGRLFARPAKRSNRIAFCRCIRFSACGKTMD